MLNAKNLLYGFAASLLLFTIVIAVEQIHPRPVDADIAASGPSRDAKQRVPRARGASVSTEEPADIEAALEDDAMAPGKSPAKSSAAPRTESAAAPTRSPSAPKRQSSAVDEGWLNTIAATLAGALPFGAAAPATPGQPAAPATLSEMPPADQLQVRDVLYSDSADTACLPGNREFILEDVRGLYVCVVWSGLVGTYAQQVTFQSPDGHVYQTTTSAFATAQDPATGGTLEFDGRAYPVKAAGWGAEGRVLVTAMLPVAGTFITQYNLAGLWTVKVSLNGQPIVQDTFELTSRN